MDKLYVRQQKQLYSIYLQGFLIAQIYLGEDGQYARDVVTLKPILKALALHFKIGGK